MPSTGPNCGTQNSSARIPNPISTIPSFKYSAIKCVTFEYLRFVRVAIFRHPRSAGYNQKEKLKLLHLTILHTNPNKKYYLTKQLVVGAHVQQRHQAVHCSEQVRSPGEHVAHQQSSVGSTTNRYSD